MRDIRDPLELYRRIMHEQRVHKCGILEAADRVELHRGLAVNPGAERLPPGTPEVARIVGTPRSANSAQARTGDLSSIGDL